MRNPFEPYVPAHHAGIHEQPPSPEYPPYESEEDEVFDKSIEKRQANWAEERNYKPSYIRNKPNLVLSVAGKTPEDGNVVLYAKDVNIGAIPNQEIYLKAQSIFTELE